MTLRSDIFDRCTTGGHAGLSALIGTRCYLSRLPEKYTLPLLVYRTVSATNEYTRDRGGASGRAKYRIQFDAYASTATAANALADQVVAAWDGYNGTGCPLGKCFVMNRSMVWQQSLNMYRQIVDVQVERATDT